MGDRDKVCHMSGWDRISSETCDMCGSPAVWRHATGFRRCETCAKPNLSLGQTHVSPSAIPSCNLHEDCRAADVGAFASRGRAATHCSADDCEECFGN